MIFGMSQKMSLCLFTYQAVFEHEEQMREQAKKMNVQSLRSSSDANKTRAEVRLAKVGKSRSISPRFFICMI
jgi:hypothetical protein